MTAVSHELHKSGFYETVANTKLFFFFFDSFSGLKVATSYVDGIANVGEAALVGT